MKYTSATSCVQLQHLYYIVYLTAHTGTRSIARVMKITKDHKGRKEAVAGRGNGVRPAMYQFLPLRVTGEMHERVRTVATAEARRAGFTITVAEVLRKALSIGLAQMERSVGK